MPLTFPWMIFLLFTTTTISTSPTNCHPQYQPQYQQALEYPQQSSLTLNCVFTVDTSSSTYDCISINASLTDPNQSIFTLDGNHIQNRTNADVNGIKIASQICYFLPQNLGTFMPNLKSLEVSQSGLRQVAAENFYQMQNLQFLKMRGNKLEILPYGLLRSNRALISLDFSDNFLTLVASDLFNSLEKLKFADFGNNLCVKNAPASENVREWEREVRRNCNEMGTRREETQALWKIIETLQNLRNYG